MGAGQALGAAGAHSGGAGRAAGELACGTGWQQAQAGSRQQAGRPGGQALGRAGRHAGGCAGARVVRRWQAAGAGCLGAGSAA